MTNIILNGVGGQGVILVSKLLMEIALKAGFDTKGSEVHGMAQRGGSVECNIRFGTKVHSPIIPKQKADFIVSLELLESMRRLKWLKPGGKLLVNTMTINPTTVTTGKAQYPDNIAEWLTENVPGVVLIDTTEAFKELGSKKVLNVIMLGALSNFLDFPEELIKSVMNEKIKEQFRDLNMSAFDIGRSLVKQ